MLKTVQSGGCVPASSVNLATSPRLLELVTISSQLGVMGTPVTHCIKLDIACHLTTLCMCTL